MDTFARLLRPRTRQLRLAWIIACLLMCLSFWLGIESYRAAHLAALAESELRLSADRARLADQAVKPLDAEKQAQWLALRAGRDFPWERMFEVIERAATPDVELLDFHPDKRNRQLVLRGEARDVNALLAYLEALSAAPQMRQVYLAHRQNVVRDRLATVEFEIRGSIN